MPVEGDMLIVSRDDRHFVSIFPEKPLIGFKMLTEAWDFAHRWLEGHPSASLWFQQGETIRLITFPDLPRPISRRGAHLRRVNPTDAPPN